MRRTTRVPKPWRRKMRVRPSSAAYLKKHPGQPVIERFSRRADESAWAHARWDAIDVADGCDVPMAMNAWLSGARNKPPRGGVLSIEQIGNDWFWVHRRANALRDLDARGRRP